MLRVLETKRIQILMMVSYSDCPFRQNGFLILYLYLNLNKLKTPVPAASYLYTRKFVSGGFHQTGERCQPSLLDIGFHYLIILKDY